MSYFHFGNNSDTRINLGGAGMTENEEKKEEKSYTLDKIMWEMLKDKGEMRLG